MKKLMPPNITMSSICNSFIQTSGEVKKWLSKQPEVKEETLTDWFLYNLSERNPVIHYKQFTRIEEGRSKGADWEWWFIFPDNKSFAARIQAKKLKPGKDGYTSVAYTGKDKLQIERLIEDSETDGMAAFYVFYSTEKNFNVNCEGDVDGGVFIAEANNIFSRIIEAVRKPWPPKDIINLCYEISCLFCCELNTEDNDDIQKIFRSYLLRYFPTWEVRGIDKDSPIAIGFKETPSRIIQLLDNPEIINNWESEYRNAFLKTKALLIVDMRDRSRYSDRVIDQINRQREKDRKNPDGISWI